MNEKKNWFEIKKQFIELYLENPRKADLFAYEQGVKPRTAQLWAFQARKIKEMRQALSQQEMPAPTIQTSSKVKMINCPGCGAIYSEKLPSCPQCGANKPSEPAPEPSIEPRTEQPSEIKKQVIEVIDTGIPLSEIDDLDEINKRLEKLMSKKQNPEEII